MLPRALASVRGEEEGGQKESWLQEPRGDGGQSGEATTADALAARVIVTANPSDAATSLGYGRARSACFA